MTVLGYTILGIALLISLVAWRQASARKGTYATLSSRMPEPDAQEIPLGMEATDIDLINRTTRRNESLERANTSLMNKSKTGRLTGSDLSVQPWADDETYAKRFHSAFMRKDKGKQT